MYSEKDLILVTNIDLSHDQRTEIEDMEREAEVAQDLERTLAHEINLVTEAALEINPSFLPPRRLISVTNVEGEDTMLQITSIAVGVETSTTPRERSLTRIERYCKHHVRKNVNVRA